MSALVKYLPNNPVMVEGYCMTGLPDQRYLTSTQRAMAVREYLISRFHLQEKRVGIMPEGDRTPPDTGKKTWDGISLVLIVSKH
jgi:OmpA family protein